jgi:hypothetical protein
MARVRKHQTAKAKPVARTLRDRRGAFESGADAP